MNYEAIDFGYSSAYHSQNTHQNCFTKQTVYLRVMVSKKSNDVGKEEDETKWSSLIAHNFDGPRGGMKDY